MIGKVIIPAVDIMEKIVDSLPFVAILQYNRKNVYKKSLNIGVINTLQVSSIIFFLLFHFLIR